MENRIIIKCAGPGELDACYKIRREVFIGEQNVPEEIERDEYDAAAAHFIAYNEGRAIATARAVLKDGGKTAKIGRVAVLKSARGTGIGRILMQAIERAPELSGVTDFILEAQTHALSFYEKLGYRSHGEEFMDAGIPHFHMRKPAMQTQL
ncbi:MAG: GNAT family N-acetyltransferase [Alphaproteobacteria bacterium]|nr:GNAT family N-acetyltransferase [Alphaproteobacteria bacterium]